MAAEAVSCELFSRPRSNHSSHKLQSCGNFAEKTLSQNQIGTGHPNSLRWNSLDSKAERSVARYRAASGRNSRPSQVPRHGSPLRETRCRIPFRSSHLVAIASCRIVHFATDDNKSFIDGSLFSKLCHEIGSQGVNRERSE